MVLLDVTVAVADAPAEAALSLAPTAVVEVPLRTLTLLATVFVSVRLGAVYVRGRPMPLRPGGIFSYPTIGETRVALDATIDERAPVGFFEGPEGSIRAGQSAGGDAQMGRDVALRLRPW
ncbi:MAG: hypothetical protein FJ090_19460 [Deltaproteobacteria bacterium]|nr:hypothetical protein [Deltaproteobacteria bacterium]